MAEVVTAPAGEVPEGGCLAVADGRVLLTKIDGEVRAFENRCLHRATALDGGTVRDGVLTCPAHFWRYRIVDGAHVGSGQRLASYPVDVDGVTVHVELPDEPSRSLREQLLEHARTWSRDD